MYALDAVMIEAEDWRASLDIQVAKYDLRVNGALAVGNVVFSTLGNADRLEYTVIGEAVNQAAKLEKHNKELGSVALFSQSCFAMAQAQGYRRDHPDLEEGEPRALQPELHIFAQQTISGVSETIDLRGMFCK